MDIPDISLVVQFGVADNLAIWLQRAGRAGHSPDVQVWAIMLVKKSVVQKVGIKKQSSKADGGALDEEGSESEFEEEEEMVEDADVARQPVEYRKTVDENIRVWIEMVGCRRAVGDVYFDNLP